jgi:Zn-dependent protease with chaperone function
VLLRVEAAGLLGLTVLLAGPVPAALARARWTGRSPRAALVLWQAVGLGGGLGILTAGLTLAAAGVSPHWLPGLVAVPSHWAELGAAGWAGVVLTGCVGAWLVTATCASAVRVLRARRMHRRRLDAIADALRVGADAGSGGGVKVQLIDHPLAVAYCLPGLRPRVVLSRGTLGALGEGELAAVLAHEQAHARGHHDLVTQPFIAWAQTFPFLPTASRAVAAVSLLVEMLADDAALRRCHPDDLRRALARLSGEQAPGRGSASLDLGRQLDARAGRLATPVRTLRRPVSALTYAAAAALVLVPPLVLILS